MLVLALLVLVLLLLLFNDLCPRLLFVRLLLRVVMLVVVVPAGGQPLLRVDSCQRPMPSLANHPKIRKTAMPRSDDRISAP